MAMSPDPNALSALNRFPGILPMARFAIAILLWSVPVWVMGGMTALAIYAALSLPVVAMAGQYPHDRIGLCNVMTLGRLAFCAMLAARLGHEPGWTEMGLALAALATDGIDGWAARRARLVSAFGARFDMEVDAFLGLVLAGLAVGKLGEWVLVLGVLRYLWLLAGAFLPWLMVPLPERYSRKVVCVLQISALILMNCPAVPVGFAAALAGAATIALVWSFGVDAIWCARQARKT